MKAVAVLGATGSIGRSTLDVVAAHPERLRVVALTAGRRADELAALAMRLRPEVVALSDPDAAARARHLLAGSGVAVLAGSGGVEEVGAWPGADTVVSAISGTAGLLPTLRAVEAGKRVALANKETLVAAGPLVLAAARRTGARLLPVDSEHAAIFQAIGGGCGGGTGCCGGTRGGGGGAAGTGCGGGTGGSQIGTAGATTTGGGGGGTAGAGAATREGATTAADGAGAVTGTESVRRLILTASGGPFRGMRPHQLDAVTPEAALRHPTWRMGPRISIDSATLMNKGLEIIEASWLFGLGPERIDVVVHPQSVVHALVEFVDGSLLAQASVPDMRLFIQYALSHPERWPAPVAPLDLAASGALSFEPPDREAFPCLDLARAAARTGGTAPAVLNAADEVAVARFLAGEIGFLDLPRLVAWVLERHRPAAHPDIDAVLAADAWARRQAAGWDLRSPSGPTGGR